MILMFSVVAGIARFQVARDGEGHRDEGRWCRQQTIPIPMTPKCPCYYCAAGMVRFALILEIAKRMSTSPNEAEIDADALA